MCKTRLYLYVIVLFFSLTAQAQVPGSAINVLHYNFTIQLNDENNNIKGKADITVKFLKQVNAFHIDLIKKSSKGGMLVSAVQENGKELRFSQESSSVNIYATENPGAVHTYSIVYAGIPADGLIISKNKFGRRTFFGDNWAYRAHNWLPCVDDPADKASVDFVITAPDHYQVIANGIKVGETELPRHLKLTHWTETAELPTKVMVLGAADFAIDHVKDVNGIPVYTYVFPENAASGFKSYAIAADILPFYMNKIGPYAYKKLANVQSKTIFGGMENASAIFYEEKSVGSKGIEELMAHEIAHQWFGDAVSEKSFHHLWLSEGFATYLANCYLENKYGTDTLKKRLIKDRDKVFDFEKPRLTPVVDTIVNSNYIQLLNPNSYEKGGWVLHMLRHELGDAVFWRGIRAYFAKYDGSNANTDDFRTIMEQASGKNLVVFFKQWLNTTGHPDLAINWKYDTAVHKVIIQVNQRQSTLCNFPLDISIDGKVYTIDVTGLYTETTISTTRLPVEIKADPNVNLLASFVIAEKP